MMASTPGAAAAPSAAAVAAAGAGAFCVKFVAMSTMRAGSTPEPMSTLAWTAVSEAVAGCWSERRNHARRYGTQPPKHNTVKACGRGVHCHARYPMDWCKKLDEIIMLCAGVSPTQPSFAFVMELSEATRGTSSEDHGPWSSREEEEEILSASHWTVRVAIESLRDELRQARAALAEKERGAA